MPDDRVLQTKLATPAPHPLAVERVHALDWLDSEVPAAGAVVISTLPGSGRLELLARWAETRSSGTTAWLQLDAWDDRQRFVRHLVAALQRIDDRIGATIVDELDGPAPYRETVVPVIAADCARHGDPITVVIHGVDRIVDPGAADALWATHRYRPANVRLIWVSDDDGPADFQTVDGVTRVPHLDQDLLAFTTEHVVAMHAGVAVDISEANARALVRSTGGWAFTVLHCVERARDVGEPVPYDPMEPGLAARIDRIVRLPPELHTVAADLALLGAATTTQFEDLTDRSDAGGSLGRLRRRHVVDQRDDRWSVVVPLRAHLRVQRETRDAPAAVVLRRRMARASAADGDVRGALDLLAEAGDAEARARLLLERHRQWSAEGRSAVAEHTVAALVDAPDQAELHLVRAWYAAFNADDLDEATAYVDAAERVPLDGARALRAHSELEFIRAVVARRAGRLVDCGEHANAGAEIGRQIDATAERELAAWPYLAVVPATVDLYVGHCAFHAGNLSTARDALLRANASRSWSPPALAAMHGVLGLIGWLEEDPSAQIHGAIAASNLGDDLNSSNHLAGAALALTGSGVDAREMAERYVEEAPRIGERTADVFAHLVELHHGTGDARRVLAAARGVVDRCEQPGVLSLALARAASMVDSPDTAPELGEPLSDGERRVVLALRGDQTEREIAAELHLSHNTVRAYRRRAYRKLGVTSRQEAVARLEELRRTDQE